VIKAIFFDVGATLLTPADNEGVTFARLAKEHGFWVDPVEVAKKIPLMYELYEQRYEQDDSFWSDDARARAVWIEMYEYMASLLGLDEQCGSTLAQAVYSYYFSHEAWKLFDDVLPTLETLRKCSYRMALISNWDATLISIIDGLGIAHYFEAIISSADVRLHKPMPQIFQLALDALGVNASEALHVGDHPYADVEGAREVGIRPVLLDRHSLYENFNELRIKSLLDIKTVLETSDN